MKSLPTALVGSLLAVIVISCGSDNHPSAPAPLASPSITDQPASQTIYSGGTANFSIAVDGNPAPTIAWQRSDDKGATWNTISGATSATYKFTVQPADTGAQFRALATNSQGNVLSTAATLTEVPAVYAGGMIDVTNPDAGYWLNGTFVHLSSPTGTTAEVTALSVSGNKVIAAAIVLSSSPGAPGFPGGFPTGYWVDGNWVDLALPSGYTFGVVVSIAVAGDDLYFGGELFPGGAPGYWLNGTWNGLPVPQGSDFAYAYSMAISGADVYVAGYGVSKGSVAPGYWVNGAWTGLPVPADSVNSIVESVVVSGSDIYAAGFISSDANAYAGIPGYWLNGNWVGLALPSGQTEGAVTSIVLSGTDVYAAGFSENATVSIPGYWLNGAWVGLKVPAGLDGGEVHSLVLSGGKVYAAGFSSFVDRVGSFSTVPGYWVDGHWVALPIPAPGTGNSRVRSLVVIP